MTFCGIPALVLWGPLPTHQPFLPPPFGLYLCLSPPASQAAPRNSAGKFSSLFVACFAFQGLRLTTPKGTNNILFEAKSLLPWDELCASPTMVNWLPAVQSLKNSNSHTLTCRQADRLRHSFTYTHAYALTNNHIHIYGVRAHTYNCRSTLCAHTLSHRLGHADALMAFNSTQRSSLKPRLIPPGVCVHVSVYTGLCVCMCLCVHGSVCVHVSVCTRVCVCACLCVYMDLCVCMCLCVHGSVCVHVSVYMGLPFAALVIELS